MGASHPTFRAGVPLALAVGVLALLEAGCASNDPPAETPAPRVTHENLHSILWSQHAAEYRAVCLQTYNQARGALDRALEDSTWTAALEQTGEFRAKPPAIILDVDETVLDNTYYEVSLIRSGKFYGSETWDSWVYEARATAVPGALEFCQYAADQRVAIFYVTNRKDHLREATRENLQALGFPLIQDDRESVHTRSDVRDKGPRRAAIAEDYRVIALFGDNLGDFLSGTQVDNETRKAMADNYASFWGERWFMLPNPAYGDWEGAIFDYDYTISDAEELRRKHEALLDR